MLQVTKAPAYLLDPLWRAACWNAAGEHLFASWIKIGEPCLLRYVFLDQDARQFIQDWDNRARRLVAEFRADTAHSPDNPAIRALVEALVKESPAFAQLWNDHAVLAREGGLRVFTHPQDGVLHYHQVTLVPAAYPGYKLVVLLPNQH